MQEQHDWMDVERRSGTYEFGRREGHEEGLQEGARAALRELIVSSLSERELAIDDASATQIQNCDDLALLQRWARRAMTVTSVAQIFE